MVRKDNRETNGRLILISVLTLIALSIFGLVFYKVLEGGQIKVEEKIVLSAEYKNTDGAQIEIAKQTSEENVVNFFENTVKEKKDFVLYVSLPICNGDAAKFKEFVLDFQHKNKVSFYYLTSDYIKDTSVYETVKYFPSVIIYKDGKIINYLRYDSDEDKEYYKSYDGFSKWLRANVEL